MKLKKNNTNWLVSISNQNYSSSQLSHLTVYFLEIKVKKIKWILWPRPMLANQNSLANIFPNENLLRNLHRITIKQPSSIILTSCMLLYRVDAYCRRASADIIIYQHFLPERLADRLASRRTTNNFPNCASPHLSRGALSWKPTKFMKYLVLRRRRFRVSGCMSIPLRSWCDGAHRRK